MKKKVLVLLGDLRIGELEAGDQIVGQVVGDGIGFGSQRRRNRRPGGISRGADGTRAKLSRIDRIDLVRGDFAAQRVGKIQRAPLPRSNVVAVIPVSRWMRLGVPNDIKGFVGVGSRRNNRAIYRRSL